MFRVIVFFSLITSAFASATLDVLVMQLRVFSATIHQQLEMLQSNPSPAEWISSSARIHFRICTCATREVRNAEKKMIQLAAEGGVRTFESSSIL